MKNNDVQLINRSIDGDDTAFAELVEKYQKQVHALVWRKIGDFHIAEEITQDTFLNAYQKLTTLKKPQQFASWLYVIATNRCSSWLRKKHLRKQLLKDKDTTHREKPTYSAYMLEENERITAQTQQDVVQKLLAKLKESERTVMTLHYFGDMSCKEIGAFLGVSTNTVKSRLHRAQQRLQKEEPVIREALDNFQISPNLTETIMGEISRTKVSTPTSGKPLIPWSVAASTLAVVLLILGFGNHRNLVLMQQPYSLDAKTKMSVDIIEVPIVANLETTPNEKVKIGNVNAQDKTDLPQQPDDSNTQSGEIQSEETIEHYTKWELPKAAEARLGKGGINVMQFSPDGTLLAVGSSIGVWLYDVKTGKELSMFPGWSHSLAFSPDGRFLVNGGGVGVGGTGRYHGEEIQLLEVSTGKRVPLAKSPSPSSALRFSEDGKTLISLGYWGDTISVINIETGEMNLKSFREKPKDRAYAESYALTHDKLAIGGVSGKIQLWDPIPSKTLPISREHSGQSEQGNVQEEIPFEIGKNEHILGLAFSPDGSQLAIGSEDGTVLLWDTTDNNEPIILRQHRGRADTVVSVRILAFSPNGKVLASEDTNTIKLWNTENGKLLATLKGHIDRLMALTFSPDGSTLASASTDGTVRFWDTETNKPLPIHISEHTPTQRGMAIIEDSNTLASVAYNGIITFWDLKTQRKIGQQTEWHCDLLLSLAFSSDGTKLAIPQQQLIHLTDVRTGREIERLKVTEDRISSAMAVSPDGKTVAFNSSSEIRLWNIDSGEILNIPLNMPFIMPLKDRAVPTVAIRNAITTMIFSRDGKKFVSGDSQGNVQIWDVKTGDELTNFLIGDEIEEPMDNGIRPMFFSKKRITALAISSDAALLAVGTLGQIQVFRSEKKTQIMELSKVPCNALEFSPDETVLVVGLATGGIQLLDISTGDELATLDGHTAPIVELLFSSDGKKLVSTGYDGTILIWDWDEALKGLQQ